LETAQNDPVKFVQDFEPNDDINDFADVPDPALASEGNTLTNQALLDAGTSLHRQQYMMSRAMAESVSQKISYSNRNMYYMAAQGTFNRQMEADLFHFSCLERQESMRNRIAFHAEIRVTSCTYIKPSGSLMHEIL
jgi:hypothetical protein